MHWTESYFDHAYAKRWGLGPPSATTRAEATQLLTLLNLPSEALLLDVGCGQGRYALALAASGCQLVGLDASRSLLQLATQHAAQALEPPRWVRADMRQLPFRSRFNGALLLDSFGFFDGDEENASVLRELRAALLPKARLIVAVANATPILADFRAHDVEQRGTTLVELDRTLQRHPAQLLEVITLREAGEARRYERRQRLYSEAELAALLRTAAFVVRAVLADYSGAPFNQNTSSKIVVLADAAA